MLTSVITGIIDKDEWWRTYLFKPTDQEAGCVQLNAVDHEPRTQLLLAAYFNDKNVKINVVGNHEVEGVAFGDQLLNF